MKKEAERKEEILAVAAKLFQEKGYRGTTCDHIAKKMGFTKASIYYYFRNKDDILREINDRAIRLFLDSAQEIVSSSLNPIQKMEKMLKSHTKLILENLAWFSVFYRERKELPHKMAEEISDIGRRYNKLLKDIYQDGVEQGFFKKISPLIAISAIFGPSNALYRWFNLKGGCSSTEMIELYNEILADGYLTSKGRKKKTISS